MTWDRDACARALAARWSSRRRPGNGDPAACRAHNARLRAERESRELRAHPTARMLLAVDPTLTDDALRAGIAAARERCIGWLEAWGSRR